MRELHFSSDLERLVLDGTKKNKHKLVNLGPGPDTSTRIDDFGRYYKRQKWFVSENVYL
jgi:hypothetical protein